MFYRLICQLLTILLLWLPLQAWSAPAPALDVGENEFDFGEIFQGDRVDHVFSFRNSGDAPLLIDRIKSSCGCTAALLSAKEIPAGGEGTIKASFDSSRFRGAIAKVIFLYSNAPGLETSRFTLKGTIKPLVDFSPQQLDFGNVAVDAEAAVDFVLVNAGEKELLIENIRASNTAFSTTCEADKLAPGVEVNCRAVARPRAETPHLNGHVLIRTDNASLGEIRVPGRGVIVKPAGQ